MDKTIMLNSIRDYYNFISDAEFSRFLGIKPQVLSNWKSRNTFNPELLYTKCLELNPEWLLTGKGNMLKNTCCNNKSIPLISVDSMTKLEKRLITTISNDVKNYIIPDFTELNADFMTRVKGNSMYPKYSSGDLIACKKLSLENLFFQWNKIYVLNTEQEVMIRRVKQSEIDDCIKIVSDNSDYGSFDIQLNKIFAVSLVVGAIQIE